MIRFPNIPPLSGSPPDTVRVHELLEDLRVAFENIGKSVTRDLAPPLTDEELRKRCAWFPGEIASEIFSLYSWRGGQQLRAEESFAPFWFRDTIFSTPEAAAVEYQSMMETYGDLLTPGMIGVDLAHCFPFAAFNGGWYVFPCGGQALETSRSRGIVAVFQGIDVYYYSLVKMLETCRDWVRHPRYVAQGADWANIEMEIWREHNPGIFSAPY